MINTILGNRNSGTPIKIKDATELIEKIGDLWLTDCDISYEFTVIGGKSINGWVVLMKLLPKDGGEYKFSSCIADESGDRKIYSSVECALLDVESIGAKYAEVVFSTQGIKEASLCRQGLINT